MSRPASVAIDGPVASGKSAVGSRLADKWGYLFFDTGLWYRAVTYLALQKWGAVNDVAAVVALAQQVQLEIRPPTVNDGRQCTLLADNADLTWAVRAPDVEANVSPVAAIAAVRQTLTARMRQVGLRGQIVMVGRDVGTVILPEAELKVFLTATVDVRARRRFLEFQARGEEHDYAAILANLRERDHRDTSRLAAPLRPAEDAIVLDTSYLDVEGVVAAIEALVAD